MRRLHFWRTVFFLCASCTVEVIGSPAQTFTTLVNFSGTDGQTPEDGPLIQGREGNIYGTTGAGGAVGGAGGTAFKMTPEGTLTTLCSFGTPNCSNGFQSYAGLVLATNGNFYSATGQGGANGWGILYKMAPTGTITTLYSFCAQQNCTDGVGTGVALLQASDGNLYGTTPAAPVFNNPGTIFRITPGSVFTTLYTFCSLQGCADGESNGGLLQGSDGNLYGTTTEGGAHLAGTIYKLNRAGKLTTLYSFCSQQGCSDGSNPGGLPVQTPDGDFYGTTVSGGIGPCAFGCGTAFKMTQDGKLTTIHSFDFTDGGLPTGLVLGTDGNFYGATQEGGDSTACSGFGCGTVFKMTADGTVTTLHIFEGSPDGAFPGSALFQATNGKFYGTTTEGGDGLVGSCINVGCGTVFSVDVGLGPFVTFVQRAGKVGQTAEILGQGLTGTTNLSFNGIPASFTVTHGTYITATVPVGATTGPVTVSTPEGILTSNVPFRVIP